MTNHFKHFFSRFFYWIFYNCGAMCATSIWDNLNLNDGRSVNDGLQRMAIISWLIDNEANDVSAVLENWMECSNEKISCFEILEMGNKLSGNFLKLNLET